MTPGTAEAGRRGKQYETSAAPCQQLTTPPLSGRRENLDEIETAQPPSDRYGPTAVMLKLRPGRYTTLRDWLRCLKPLLLSVQTH